LSDQCDKLFSLPTTPANISATFVIADDFNKFNTGFLESDSGLTQTVSKPTHCNHINDKLFNSWPETSYVDVLTSCIKTKHQAATSKCPLTTDSRPSTVVAESSLRMIFVLIISVRCTFIWVP
jgi:hypothetical protein